MKNRSDIIELWLKALESGEYKQTKDRLFGTNSAGEKTYCCLGVACVIYNQESTTRKAKIDFISGGDDYNFILPQFVARKLGISLTGEFKKSVKHNGKEYDSLSELNDNGVKFRTIARIIRQQLTAKNFESK